MIAINTDTPSPGTEILRVRRQAWKMGPVPGGFATDIEIARRLLPVAPAVLALWSRIRLGRAHSAASDAITALKWMLAHPGQTPTPALIWPHLFANR